MYKSCELVHVSPRAVCWSWGTGTLTTSAARGLACSLWSSYKYADCFGSVTQLRTKASVTVRVYFFISSPYYLYQRVLQARLLRALSFLAPFFLALTGQERTPLINQEGICRRNWVGDHSCSSQGRSGGQWVSYRHQKEGVTKHNNYKRQSSNAWTCSVMVVVNIRFYKWR